MQFHFLTKIIPMRTNIYTILLLCIALMGAHISNAQCGNGRYLTTIFPTYSVTTDTYSIPYSLVMDIYQPTGDTYTKRPLVILAHGGSFIGGTRNDDSTCVQLCRNLCQRGYVTASIDYRLGTIGNLLDSAQVIDVVVKSISDGKAAVRYFMKDASTTNTYKIDTNNIFIGGNSAGAVLYMHVGYLDSLGECPNYIVNSMNSNGGFEGNSGNAGYTTKFKAIIDLAGGLNKVSFIGPGDKPSVNAQGDQDAVVPYTCGEPNPGVVVPITLCGLGSMEPQFNAESIYHWSLVFPGAGHVPWDNNPAVFPTVDSLVTNFLYTLVCGTTGVNEISQNAECDIYPNPASTEVSVRSSLPIGDVYIYDISGRLILQTNAGGRKTYDINTSQLAKGMYMVRIYNGQGYMPLIKKLTIE
jgi:hypothetical protein